MCAIAALASCSQNEDEVAPPVSNATEATVTIKLAGNDLHSRITSTESDDALAGKNNTVNDITVFILNKAKAVITKQFLKPSQGGAFAPINTTTDADQVAVITNVGETLSKTLFAAVGNETALRGVLASLLNSAAPTQTDQNLYMSGMNGVGDFTEDGQHQWTASVNVVLNYLPARIKLEKISFNGGSAPGATKDNNYVPYNQFKASLDANFTITRVYLINVQSQSRFLPMTPNGSNYTEGIAKTYSGGVAMGVAPWTTLNPPSYTQNGEYSIEGAVTTLTASTNTISNIGHWYTFMNTGVKNLIDYPTALVVEVLWRETKPHTSTGPQDPAVKEKLTTKYFTVYFGGGDKDGAGLINELEAGKTYKVSLALNGNFKPAIDGGSGGGGTEDPSKPTINSAITVTVTPAVWVPAPDINKEWKD